MEKPKKKLRVLHIHHALYVNHLLVRGLRELGHFASNVYYNHNPGSPLSNLTWGCDFSIRSDIVFGFPNQFSFFLKAIKKFDIFHFWAKPYGIPGFYHNPLLPIPIDLWLLKKMGKKIIWQSEGCNTMIMPSTWKEKVYPEMCQICNESQIESYHYCTDKYVSQNNRMMDRYADLKFGMGMNLDFEKDAEFSFFPVDLDLWSPGISIPSEYIYKRENPDSLLIFHGLGLQGVAKRGNIKGTFWIKETVTELQKEGFNIELIYTTAVPNQIVRFYQAQADIVVDQLILPGGGQMSRECLALGKPVLTRMHPRVLETYRRTSYQSLPPPYIPTDRNTLKRNLIKLIENPDLRGEIGKQSSEFAKNNLSPKTCAEKYATFYQSIMD